MFRLICCESLSTKKKHFLILGVFYRAIKNNPLELDGLKNKKNLLNFKFSSSIISHWLVESKSTKITITLSSRPHYTNIPLACALYDPHHDVSAGSHAAGPWWGTQPHHTHPASAMYEDTTGQNTTTHHSPPLLSAHNPNTLLSIQQAQQHQQQTTVQSSHSSQQSSQTNGSHTNGTVASAQSQIVTPSAASDSPVSPPTGNFFFAQS